MLPGRRILVNMKNFLVVLCLVASANCFGQSLGNAGTVEGTVVDPSGAAVAKAVVTIHNAITNYGQTVVSAADGSFRLVNLPPNPYHLEVNAPGFNIFTEDVSVRNSVPVQIKVALALS